MRKFHHMKHAFRGVMFSVSSHHNRWDHVAHKSCQTAEDSHPKLMGFQRAGWAVC